MKTDRFDLSFARTHGRAALWGLGAFAVVALFLYVIVPFIASTRIVKDRIAFELSVWSGYRVSIDSDPTIRLFPLRAVLKDVELAEWARPGPPVLIAEQMIMDLSPVAALTGDVYFNRVRLSNPVLRVEATPSGLYLPRLPGGGRMANAVKDARVLAAQNPDNPDLSDLPGDPFGRVEFSNGRILNADGDTEIATTVQGVVSWPRLDGTGSLKASGTWRGEAMNIEFSSNEPMVLMAGGTARTRIAFAGAPGNAAFEGILNLSEKPFFQGEGTFATSSLRRTLEWSHADLKASPQVNAVSLQGQVLGDLERVKFDRLQLTLDGSAGSGAVELQLNRPRPALSGTLAFQKVNLGSLFSALAPVSEGKPIGTIDTTFSKRLDLDLRMSATEALLGRIPLADVAATARTRDGLAAFDISDARAFDGSLQAGLRFDRKDRGLELETAVRANDIDGGALGSALGLTRAVPASRGSFSLMLKGPIRSLDHITDGLTGTFSASFGPGTLAALDLNGFLAKVRQGGFFALNEVSAGTLAIDRLDLQTTVANNVARFDRAEILAGQNRIRWAGVVSYAGRGLAVSGSVLTEAQNGEQAASRARFFVGGTWTQPFVTPAAPPAKPD